MLQERQQLESKTVEELRKICKERGISYYEKGKRLTKGLMIDKLLQNKQNKQEEKEKNEPEPVSAEKAERLELDRLERKKKYIEQAKIGTVVAFKLQNGKVISAAITKKSTKGRKFMVETAYGVEYKISFDDVLWVKTNKRWPKGIYMLFKQNIKTEVIEDGKEIG